jgi:hypothetical protein
MKSFMVGFLLVITAALNVHSAVAKVEYGSSVLIHKEPETLPSKNPDGLLESLDLEFVGSRGDSYSKASIVCSNNGVKQITTVGSNRFGFGPMTLEFETLDDCKFVLARIVEHDWLTTFNVIYTELPTSQSPTRTLRIVRVEPHL